jgi:hypothetical protein
MTAGRDSLNNHANTAFWHDLSNFALCHPSIAFGLIIWKRLEADFGRLR